MTTNTAVYMHLSLFLLFLLYLLYLMYLMLDGWNTIKNKSLLYFNFLFLFFLVFCDYSISGMSTNRLRSKGRIAYWLRQ